MRGRREVKIALSGQTAISAPLSFVQADLAESISRDQLADAISQPLMRIEAGQRRVGQQPDRAAGDLPDRQRTFAAAARRAATAARHSDRRRQRLRLGHRQAGALGANAVPLTVQGRGSPRRSWRLCIMSTILTSTATGCGCAWRDDDLPAFAALNADPQVMRYFPAAMTAEESARRPNASAPSCSNMVGAMGGGSEGGPLSVLSGWRGRATTCLAPPAWRSVGGWRRPLGQRLRR